MHDFKANAMCKSVICFLPDRRISEGLVPTVASESPGAPLGSAHRSVCRRASDTMHKTLYCVLRYSLTVCQHPSSGCRVNGLRCVLFFPNQS